MGIRFHLTMMRRTCSWYLAPKSKSTWDILFHVEFRKIHHYIKLDIPCYFVKIFKPFFIPLNVFVQRKRNESPSNGNQRLHKWHLVSQGAFWSNRRLLWFDWWTWRNEGKQGKQRAKNTPRSRIDDLQSNKVIALPNKYINDYIYMIIIFYQWNISNYNSRKDCRSI